MRWPYYPGYPKQETIDILKKLSEKSTEEEWLESLKHFNEYLKYNGYAFICNDATNIHGFPSQRWSVIHHMAYLHAPVNVINEYREKGFFVGLKDMEGRRAIDYVNEEDDSYKKLFKPSYKVDNPDVKAIQKIETRFHELIRKRVAHLIDEHQIVLPDLMCYLEKVGYDHDYFFDVPGFYGGFRTHFKYVNTGLIRKKNLFCLESESFCRIWGGSAQLHRIFEDNTKLIDHGYF